MATFADLVLSDRDLTEVMDQLRAAAQTRVITGALSPREAENFERCGFEELRNLTLLRRRVDEPIRVTGLSLRRWRRRDLTPVLEVDHAAFEEFWRFDEPALHDAMSATPHRVLRVTRAQPIEGYALSGLAGSRGYLQRLAVAPASAGRGIGAGLLLDALRWMRWRGAIEAFVNTQADNTRALSLYQRHGFESEPEGLAILHRDL